jgi:hypothetical protein
MSYFSSTNPALISHIPTAHSQRNGPLCVGGVQGSEVFLELGDESSTLSAMLGGGGRAYAILPQFDFFIYELYPQK